MITSAVDVRHHRHQRGALNRIEQHLHLEAASWHNYLALQQDLAAKVVADNLYTVHHAQANVRQIYGVVSP